MYPVAASTQVGAGNPNPTQTKHNQDIERNTEWTNDFISFLF